MKFPRHRPAMNEVSATDDVNDFVGQRAWHRSAARLAFMLFLAARACLGVGAASPLPVAPLARTSPVDFEAEILPFLRESCLACHNQTKAKADLILETPQTILTGGESGAAVIPGKPNESLIFKLASHADKPVMPPKDNKANAPDLDPRQLALLKLWIEQGARGEVHGTRTIAWQALSAGVRSILGLAVTADGQLAACGRGNEIHTYQIATGQSLGLISDPELTAAGSSGNPAHLDLLQSIDFSPDGELLASGSYREAKIWRRQHSVPVPLPWTASVGAVRSMAASADGQVFALEKGAIEIRRAGSENSERTLDTGGQQPLLLALSRDGARAAAVLAGPVLRAWSVAEGKVLGETKLAGEARALAWAAKGTKLAVALADKSIQTWTLAGGAEPAFAAGKVLAGHSEAAFWLGAAGEDESALLSAGAENSARLWNLETGEGIRSFNHGSPLAACAVSPDGRRLATAGQDKLVRLWNVADGKAQHELKGERRALLAAASARRSVEYAKGQVAYRQSGLAAAAKEKEAQVERVRKASDGAAAADKAVVEKEKAAAAAKAEQTAAEKAVADARAEAKAASDQADGAEAALKEAKAAVQESLRKTLEERLAARSEQLRAEVQGILTNALLRLAAAGNGAAAPAPSASSDAPATNAIPAAAAPLADAALDDLVAKASAAALARQAFTALKPEAEKREKAADEKAKATQKTAADAEAGLKPLRLAKTAAENELHFAIAGADKALAAHAEGQNILQAAEAELKQREAAVESAGSALAKSARLTRRLAFSPDGAQLAAACEDGQVAIWAAETGVALETVAAGTDAPVVAFANGSALLALSEGKLRAWKTGPAWKLEQVIGSAQGDSVFADRVNAVRFSPDGLLLATGGGEPSRGGELKLWRVSNGQLAHDLQNLHSDSVLALAFTPDGRYLASGAADRFAKITDLSNGQVVRVLEGHTHHVLSVGWKRDGHTVVTAGGDNVLKVWDAFTGEKRKNIDGFTKEVTAVSFVGETGQVLACSGDPALRLIKETGEAVRSYDGAADFLQAAAATLDGSLVLAGGQDGVLRLWQTETGKLLAAYPPR